MRQVYTENERRRLIEDYEKSSLSIRDYCQSRNISTYLYYHWKRRFKIEDSPIVTVLLVPQFRQIIKPAQVSSLSMILPNGIRIGLEGMSMEDLSHLRQHWSPCLVFPPIRDISFLLARLQICSRASTDWRVW